MPNRCCCVLRMNSARGCCTAINFVLARFPSLPWWPLTVMCLVGRRPAASKWSHRAWLDAYSHLVSRGLESADVVVAPTQWMLDALAVNFSLPARARVIANGRRLRFSGQYSERKLQAITAGRLWDEAKNLDLLQEVRSPFPILLAGEVEYESQTVATRPAATTMLGPLAEDDLLALFRESAIYLCTSQYEPFGLAPLEAALCGCAVVANDIDSLREVWADGALYFGDASSLSALLARLACDPQLLVAAQRRSWRRAERYKAARMAEQYLGLYQNMVGAFQPSAWFAALLMTEGKSGVSI